MYEVNLLRECCGTVGPTLSLQVSQPPEFFNLLLQPSNSLGPVYLND